jgi:hypothetical protein
MEIEYENEKIIYNPGDGIFIPDGPEHKHKDKVLSKKALVFSLKKFNKLRYAITLSFVGILISKRIRGKHEQMSYFG